MKNMNVFDKAYEQWIKSNDPFLMEAKHKSSNKSAKKEETNDADNKDSATDDNSKKESAIKKIIISASKNYAKERTGAWLNELFLGNFKDACIDILKSEFKSKFNDEKFIDEVSKSLKKVRIIKKQKNIMILMIEKMQILAQTLMKMV